MPSFSDSIFIFVLALMLFGPKKLPQLARQLGKLMAEFRRASSEFRMQMEDELRVEDQKEHQKKIDAMPGPTSSEVPTTDPPHPHMPQLENSESTVSGETVAAEVMPIAESGELRMMPPATGLPVESALHGTSGTIDYGLHNEFGELIDAPAVGMSSDEPMAEAQPEGEHANHA